MIHRNFAHGACGIFLAGVLAAPPIDPAANGWQHGNGFQIADPTSPHAPAK